jgi:outer membrane lipoprotein-sorting protein
VGTWHLDKQEVNGEKIESAQPMTMKVSEAEGKLAFSFSLLVKDVNTVSMTYEVKLDGTDADVKDAQGQKLGTIEMAADGPSQYKLLLKRPNRLDTAGKLIVSADGKNLTSEADTLHAGKIIHTVQQFSRR